MFQVRPLLPRCLAALCLLFPWTLPTRAMAEPQRLTMEEAEALPTAFPTTLVPPTTQSLRPVYERLRQLENPALTGKLVSIVLSLGTLRVPISVEECGVADAYYWPQKRSITLCYEHLVQANRLMGKPVAQQNQVDSTVAALVVFTAFHEIGHALVHTLSLQFPGREEDVADQFATFFMIQSGEAAFARRIVQAPAAYFSHRSQASAQSSRTAASSVHSPGLERSQNILCLLYGRYRDPEIGQKLGARAADCPAQYARAAATWNAQLAPYARVIGGKTFE